jgi:hypothetical protein
LSPPTVNIDPEARRVDVAFICAGVAITPRPQPPEVLEARWFPVEALPDLFEPTLLVLSQAGVLPADALD